MNKVAKPILISLAGVSIFIFGCFFGFLLAESGSSQANSPSLPTNVPVLESTETASQTETPAPKDTIAPTVEDEVEPSPSPVLATEPVMSPSCLEIQSETDGMTDVQWESYKEEIERKWVNNWSGTVSEVGEKGFLTGYEYPVHLETSDGCELIVYVSDENFALSLNIGDALSVSGEVSLLAEVFEKIIYIYDPVSIERR